MVLLPGQMFAQAVRRAPQRFAREVAILRGKYLEIGPLEGEWNREIDQIRAMVHREFPTNTSKRHLERFLGHVLRARKRFLVRCAQWSVISGQESRDCGDTGIRDWVRCECAV